jgi:MscS family membrane protein
MPRSWLRRALAGLVGTALSLMLAASGWSQTPAPQNAPAGGAVPLAEQPFYPALEEAVGNWQGVPLGEVIGDDPRSTLLNFYVVMADVGHGMRAVSATANTDPGLAWSEGARAEIDRLNNLFSLAVQALDASEFAESVRTDRAEEAAMQLKEVLDYVLGSSKKPFNIPDSDELNSLNEKLEQDLTSWRLPGTAIVLNQDNSDQAVRGNYLFSSSTVKQVERMYEEVRGLRTSPTAFSTPGLYTFYSETPGYLVPPKWYLRLPGGLRRVIELQIWGQTLFQILFTLITIAIEALIVVWLCRRLLATYRYQEENKANTSIHLHADNIAWIRVGLVIPILPLTRLSSTIVDAYLNITGTPLVVVTFGFYITYFLTASVLAFLFFEALGRSGSEWMMRLRGGDSPLLLQRISNFVMPICRTLGALTMVGLIYRLLILLGLPAETVLAFSAVPGLAIGLGASKLLGNLFAGLSIQTDRPLRVGEFCRVGDNLGFVTKIGLRSLELQTLDSRITIPNAIADEATIVNYSQRQQRSDAKPSQGIELRYCLTQPLSPDQVSDLLMYARREVEHRPELEHSLVSVERNDDDGLDLVCFATVELHGWRAFLQMREELLLRMQQIEDQVLKSRVVIGVSYDTTADQLTLIPDLIQQVVEADPDFRLRSCRLMAISEFSYDFVFDFTSSHTSYGAFKDGISRMNQALLASFAAHRIEIPFPTQVEIQKDA